MILFDIGYTLLFQHREVNYQKYLKDLGIERSLEQIFKAYHVSDKLFMREYNGAFGHDPTTFLPWFLGTVNYQLGVRTDLVQQFQTLQRLNDNDPQFWRPFPFVHNTLQTLKQQGYTLGIISNWDDTARPLLAQYDLSKYFDPIIISSEFGIAKPHKEIFEHALQLANVPANEVIYVGDNYYDDVIGARQVGIETVLLNPYDRLGIEEIKYDLVVESIEKLPSLLKVGRINYV